MLTDINFLAAPFTPYGWREEEEVRWEEELRDDREDALRVHGGFKLAFDSIKDEITEILEEDGEMANVVFVGHSMGGALAQLATVYFCELKARWDMGRHDHTTSTHTKTEAVVFPTEISYKYYLRVYLR